MVGRRDRRREDRREGGKEMRVPTYGNIYVSQNCKNGIKSLHNDKGVKQEV